MSRILAQKLHMSEEKYREAIEYAKMLDDEDGVDAGDNVLVNFFRQHGFDVHGFEGNQQSPDGIFRLEDIINENSEMGIDGADYSILATLAGFISQGSYLVKIMDDQYKITYRFFDRNVAIEPVDLAEVSRKEEEGE